MKSFLFTFFIIITALPSFSYTYSCVDVETGGLCNVTEQNSVSITRRITKRICLVQTTSGIQCWSIFYPGVPSGIVNYSSPQCLQVTGRWFIESCGI